MTNQAVAVSHLTYGFGGPQSVLKDLSLELPRGSRCLLVGANGAGKSTLLRILAGKRLVNTEGVHVLGKNPFKQGSQDITYLGTEWAQNPIVRRDVPVSRLLKTLGAERNQERCSHLLEIMDVDPNWHMHEISDGQRRRVQIVLGLMDPWDLLLLDEVTVDLDVLVRADLLRFLRSETETRGATILYATHIFDGLGGWSTHVAHIADGAVDVIRDLTTAGGFPEYDEQKELRANGTGDAGLLDNSPLLLVVEKWLKKDQERWKKEGKKCPEGKVMTKWEILSENMRQYGEFAQDHAAASQLHIFLNVP
ncbi:P-loop containing nucleoside triphosphate hydrolase protein [Fimicolochytrium jonesii]|uniref:P-loop containing nucleoside triphosphate hydrolase protein n=1 Tax=Fimicolochytrium jonesii TaxID=1396493 RepID=UPI0022FE13F4|nr:P-loop containing nucleoside triphosphate hydrolase protein [Fimicolochytrium jonesii]KAI8826247.1 P-loop containing nucleoside triphosphate hydrolase protein [Fimicolochytrium jonesii]